MQNLRIVVIYSLMISASGFSQPVITSDSVPPTVVQGGTHTFTATCTGGCTWGLTTGSAGSINTSTGVYTAPAKVNVNQSAYGCQLLTPDSPYNAPINGMATIAQSSNWVTMLVNGGRSLSMGVGGMPYNIVSGGTPTQAFTFNYSPSYNGNYAVPSGYDLQFGYYMRAGDRHYFTVNPSTCGIVEIYNSGGNGGGFDIYPISASAVTYNSITGSLNGGTNAAGEYFLPASLKVQDIMKAIANGSNVIPHMINVTLHNYTQLCYNGTAGGHQWPATGNAIIGCAGGDIPYGARMRLKSSYVYGGSNPITQILINTMQQFGFDVSDGGFSMVQYGADGDSTFPQLASAISEISSLFSSTNLSNFEFVDMTTLAPSVTTGAQGGLIDATKASGIGYTIPQFAEVTVTDTVGTTKLRILLQGGTVDFQQSVFNIQAGASAYTLPYYISGFASTSVNCTMSPSVGTLNSSTCQYTPPATIASPISVTVTLASVSDPTVKTQAYVNVFPQGSLGLLLSNPSNYIDSHGRTWYLVNMGSLGTAYQDANTSYTDWQLYGYSYHPRGDYGFSIQVPPGNYRVTINGISQSTSALGAQSNVIYTVQGSNVYSYTADVSKMANGVLGVPQSYVVPVVVSASGTLTVKTRHNDIGNAPGIDTIPATIGSVLIEPITCPGAATSPLPGTGVWYPFGVVGGNSVTSIDPCSAAQSLSMQPYGLFPMPSVSNR